MKYVKYVLIVFLLLGLVSCNENESNLKDDIVTYQVTIISNDESTVYEVEAGKHFNVTDPKLTAFKFSGYYTDKAFTTLWDNSVINNNVTLYVLWLPQEVDETLLETFNLLTYESLLAKEDSRKAVTTNLELPLINDVVTISWYSSNKDIINNEGNINRTDRDSEVMLTATLTYEGDTLTKSFSFIVKAKEAAAVSSPVIIGVKDIYVTIGSKVNYLHGITVTDEFDSDPLLTVDSSNVNLNKAGSYKVTYKAVNNNNKITTIEANVIVEPQYEESYVEDFNNIATNSSSYSDGSYKGVNDITWNYKGMRTDKSIEDGSLTFGASSANYLKAVIPSNIARITVDLKGVFSGTDSRKIDLIINDVVVETFEVSTSKLIYEANDINVAANATLEFRNSGGQRVIVDNIAIYSEQLSQDLTDIMLDIKNLTLPTVVMDERIMTLLDKGRSGSSISYQFTNENDINNKFINLQSGLITMPKDGQVDVFLKITFSKGTESKTIEKKITVGEGDPVTIATLLNLSGAIKTKGLLTNYIIDNNYIKGFIEDETGAVLVHFPLTYKNMLAVGTNYIIKGNINLTNNPYIDLVTKVEQLSTKTVEAVIVDGISIKNQLAKYVYLSGIMQYDYLTDDAYIVTTNGIIPVVVKANTNPFVNTKVGQEVMLSGNVVLEDNQYKIWVTDALDVEVAIFAEELFETLLLEDLNLTPNMRTNTNLELALLSDLFALKIAWQSSNESVLSNSGVVTTSDNDYNVKLTYNVYNMDFLIYSGTIDVVVSQGVLLTGYYSAANGLSGYDLLASLTNIISTDYNGISYKATNAVLEKADKHPTGNGYLGVYDYKSITSYNKEHVWPQSSFSKASPYRSDMHHLRISNSRTNSSRSNYYFNNPLTNTTTWETDHKQHRFYPGENEIGDIARMLMYVAVRYRDDNFRLIVAEGGKTSDKPARTLGNLAVLYDWHLADPVDEFEINRNNIIYQTQNNRNPFIDHPELFEEIWELFMAENNNQNLNYNNETTTNIKPSSINKLTTIIPKTNFKGEYLYA